MKFLANYIMRGPLQAILVASVAALVPPLGYFSGGAIGLVTLRLGPLAALKVMGGALLVTALIGALLAGNPVGPLLLVLGLWLPVMVVAYSLRQTVRLDRSVLLAGLFGVILVIGVHVAIPDPAAWWQKMLERMVADAPPEQHAALQQVMGRIAHMMTGMFAAALTFGTVISLFLARWWQAILYNPGGFRQEFHALRLGKVFGIVTVAVAAVALAALPGTGLLRDVLPLLVLLQLLQGLAVVHALVADAGANKAWLVAVYVVLLLPALTTQTALTLAVAGLVDNWMNFRVLFGNKTRKS